MGEMVRFVYPYVDKFFERKGIMDKAKQLRIAHTSEDGGYWFGIREAIENYCEEYHYSKSLNLPCSLNTCNNRPKAPTTTNTPLRVLLVSALIGFFIITPHNHNLND